MLLNKNSVEENIAYFRIGPLSQILVLKNDIYEYENVSYMNFYCRETLPVITTYSEMGLFFFSLKFTEHMLV